MTARGWGRLLLAGIGLLEGIHSKSWALTIQADDARARPGARTFLTVSMGTSTPPCAGVNARLVLPPQVRVTRVIKGDLLEEDHFNLYANIAEGEVTFLAYSTTGSFTGPGVLVRMEALISEAALDGNYAIAFYDEAQGIVNWRALSTEAGVGSLVPAAIAGNLRVDANENSIHAWLADYFSDEEMAAWDDPMNEDPDQDHRSNLEEYLFGGNPRESESESPAGSPLVAGGLMLFSGIFRSDDSSLRYTVDISSDFQQWERHQIHYNAGLWESTGSPVEIQDSWQDEPGLWVLRLAIPADQAVQFLRISCAP